MKCTIKCPHCGQQYEEIEYVAGQKVECENCQQSFVICMSVVIDTPVNSSLINSKQRESEIHLKNSNASPVENWLVNGKQNQSDNNIQDSDTSPIENWLGSRLGIPQKSNVEKRNSKANQVNDNESTHFSKINEAISVWSRVATIADVLFLLSLPVSSISALIILMSCSKATCSFWIPIIIIIVIQLFFGWLFSLSAQAVLEVLRSLSNDVQMISKSVTSKKDK